METCRFMHQGNIVVTVQSCEILHFVFDMEVRSMWPLGHYILTTYAVLYHSKGMKHFAMNQKALNNEIHSIGMMQKGSRLSLL